VVGASTTLGERLEGCFDHGEAVGSAFGIGAIYQLFSLRRLYFGIDGTNVGLHSCKVENEVAVRRIGSSGRLEL